MSEARKDIQSLFLGKEIIEDNKMLYSCFTTVRTTDEIIGFKIDDEKVYYAIIK